MPRRESLQPNPTYAAIAQSEPSGKDTWFLDSCCGQHMCSSGRFVQREHQLQREVVITVTNNQNLRTRRQGVVQLQSRETNVILQMSKVLIAEGLSYNLLSVSQLMAKGIHLEANSTTMEFKLYHGKGGLYIGKAVLKNNVFVLDFVPDLGTADSDGIVTFTSWTHPPDLDPDFSPEGFWYSHTIPEAERTRALATIQHSAAARWVVHGFDQERRRDFTKTFALVSRHTSLRILLAIAAMKEKKLRQINVANAFLYAPVDAKIYVELPHGSHGEPNQVCLLQKSLYEIKQAPRLRQQYLHARLIRIGFQQLPHDQGMYRLTKGDDYILLIVYVDDLLYIGSTDNVTTWFEGELQKDLTLTVSSTVTQYLGLNIQEGESAIYLNAAKYADTIAKRFALTPTTISTLL
ncbi:unnamed protein product [Closterium sp. NIES-54]